jgi:phosphatidylglycerol:prolipoprotein diacylglycerol transferase
MLVHPSIDPVALRLGPLQIHWYGIMYVLGFAIGWLLGRWRASDPARGWTQDQVSDLIFYAALGIVIGGRLGYALFYAFPELIHNPLFVFKIWEGGMAFHGGAIGVFLGVYLYGRKIHKSFLDCADFLAPLIPLGLGLGRIGNFINGEIWGRVTEVPWAMVFPAVDGLPRHPSQIYEFLTEGLLLFSIVWFYSAKPRPRGRVTALFLAGYGVIRFVMEFYREVDSENGYIAWGWLTTGQLLTAPMIIIGAILWWRSSHATIS